MKILTATFHTLAILLLISVAGLFLASMLPIPGNVEIKIVKSGSMEPAIPIGSLVVAKPVDVYRIGDVITFGADTATQIPTTHRIVGVRDAQGSTFYATKGDANEEADSKEVREGEIIGKVVLSLPYVGFILDFAKQPIGFLLLIALPAAIIILDELIAIAREIRKKWRPKKPRSGRGGDAVDADEGEARVVLSRRFAMDDIFLPMRVWKAQISRDFISQRQYTNALTSVVAIAATLAISYGGIGSTLSYFRDDETSSHNIFGAGEWVATPGPNPHNIVLNEFLPRPDDGPNGLNLGNDSSDMPLGEWVELYNNGDVKIDLSGWYISDASGGLGNQQAVVGLTNTQSATTTIPAHGWLVVYFNKAVLNNTGDSIFLYTNTNVLIDSYSYDNPSDFCELELTPGSTNSTSTPSGTPGTNCVTTHVAPNKSYARIPDGTGAWVDPIPTPGAPNIAEEEVYVMSAVSAPEEAAPENEQSAEKETPQEEILLETENASSTPIETISSGSPTDSDDSTQSGVEISPEVAEVPQVPPDEPETLAEQPPTPTPQEPAPAEPPPAESAPSETPPPPADIAPPADIPPPASAE